MSAPGHLSVEFGARELRRCADGRFRDRARRLEARFVRGFGWGMRIGSNPHCWWLSEQSSGARGRVWLKEWAIATIHAPGGPSGDCVTLTLAKEPGPFEVILAGIPAEIVQAFESGWTRGTP